MHSSKRRLVQAVRFRHRMTLADIEACDRIDHAVYLLATLTPPAVILALALAVVFPRIQAAAGIP